MSYYASWANCGFRPVAYINSEKVTLQKVFFHLQLYRDCAYNVTYVW